MEGCYTSFLKEMTKMEKKISLDNNNIRTKVFRECSYLGIIVKIDKILAVCFIREQGFALNGPTSRDTE